MRRETITVYESDTVCLTTTKKALERGKRLTRELNLKPTNHAMDFANTGNLQLATDWLGVSGLKQGEEGHTAIVAIALQNAACKLLARSSDLSPLNPISQRLHKIGQDYLKEVRRLQSTLRS